MARRGGLGTNLDALIPTSLTVAGQEVATSDEVDINLISPNPRQPRKNFDTEALNELVASIKEIGILQPPVVRVIADGRYELIMGERRYRAAKAAGLKKIPVIIRQTADNELLREALIENIHRSQLNALEEAAAYSQLLNDFACTHEELAQKLGRSRPLISNTIRLMNLPTSVQSKVASGAISAGHARALLGLSDSQQIETLAKRVVAEGLRVRALEEIISKSPTKSSKKRAAKIGSSIVEFNEIAEDIGDALDTRVTIQGKVSKGSIVIEFAGLEDLKRITQAIKN